MISGIFHKSIHLDDSKLEPLNSDCPFCGSSIRHPNLMIQENPTILLMKCINCNATSASRMPKSNVLYDYYSDYYNTSFFKDGETHVTFDNPRYFGIYLVNTYLQYNQDEYISILDYGGGDGSISYFTAVEFLNRGAKQVNVTVIDQNEKLILPQNNSISINRKTTIEEIDNQYNFVMASAIIEHLPTPRVILDSLFESVEMGGLFYARTPYVVPLMKFLNIFGLKWDFAFPAHLHDLGQDFWETYFYKKITSADFQLLVSRPSIVETSFNTHFFRTLAAHLFKAPWYAIGRHYKLVGGWEAFIKKKVKQK